MRYIYLLSLLLTFQISSAQTLTSDSLALVDLYNSTNGDGWSIRDNWLVGNVETWSGISVETGRVTEIYLSELNLVGTIPESIGNLQNLRVLDLRGNGLSGDIPTTMGQLISLVNIDISGNSISGTLPADFWNITTLNVIQLCCGNSIAGTIEPGVGNMDLYVLDLGGNNFTGDLPPELFNNTNLNYINLWDDGDAGMELTGGISPAIGNLTFLIDFNISNNAMSGTLPSEIGNLSNLVLFNVGGNAFSGSLPTEIGNLTNIETMELWGNDFSGNLPSSIGNLTQLQRLYLSDNNFSGPIPAEIGNLTLLEGIAFNNNQFTGPLPTTLGNLTEAFYFELNNNPINSDVPTEIGNMTSLRNLVMENAGLTGTFPESIFQIPSLESIYLSGNNQLTVNLPTSISAPIVDFRIDNTLPYGETFPAVLYDLNLRGLSLGNKGYTGTLSDGISNWTELNNIYLWNNNLSGDFPASFTSGPVNTLEVLNIFGNDFSSFPDLSGFSSLQSLDLRYNLLSFDDIIPNLSVPDFQYAPQNRRGETQNLMVDQGGSLLLENPYDDSGNVYNWVLNINDTIANSMDYTIENARLEDLGGYFVVVTNPAVPDLVLRSPFYNVAFSGDPRAFTVDNSPNSLADFKTFYAAFYGTNDGDTLLVAGSETPYDVGAFSMQTQKVIIGPGYFLDENSNSQANGLTAQIPYINVTPNASGSSIFGLDVESLYVNNQGSSLDEIVQNLVIAQNKIHDLSIVDDADGLSIEKNYIDLFNFSSTTAVGTSRNYTNISIDNNIIDTVSTGIAKAIAARNDMANVVFNRNTIDVFLDSIQDVTLSDNIINNYQATGNTVSNTQTFGAAGLTGSELVDSEFMTADGFGAGAFSGDDPYRLSGIGPVPHITMLEDIGRIRINLEAMNEADADIQYLNYKLGENGVVKATGTVRKLEPGNPVSVLFRPKLGKVTPGADINLMIWAKDANGVKSVHHNLTFQAETTTATGQIKKSDGTPLDNGEALLFEINQEATAFDTLATTLDANGNFTFSNIVIGDYLALGRPNGEEFPDEMPTYYTQTALWEEADTLLIDNSNPDFDITLIARPRELSGSGVVTGVIEEEVDEENAGGRVEARSRVRGAGVSMRRGRRTGRSEDTVYDLFAFVYTDDNGEFTFDGLPEDNYRINIQYPGYPMDTLTQVDIAIGAAGNDDFELEALVDEGKISVVLKEVTGLLEELINNVSIYPNPAFEKINIEFKQDMLDKEIHIQLNTLSGETLIKSAVSDVQIQNGQLSIPVDSIENGIYLLTMYEDNNLLGTVRIAVQK